MKHLSQKHRTIKQFIHHFLQDRWINFKQFHIHFLLDQYDLLPSERRYRMSTVRNQHVFENVNPYSIKYLNQQHIINRSPIIPVPTAATIFVIIFLYLMISLYWFSVFIPKLDHLFFTATVFIFHWVYTLLCYLNMIFCMHTPKYKRYIHSMNGQSSSYY